MPRIVVAPDKFKGVLSARAAAEAMAEGARQAYPDAHIDILPMADGCEGTLDCLVSARRGRRQVVSVRGPLGEPCAATVGLIDEASTAVVELAQAAGYDLVPETRRDPLRTTTYGVGETIRAVVDTAIERIIVTLGGSATCDGGAGLMQAIGLALLDRAGRALPPGIGGGRLSDIQRIVWDNPPDNLENVQFTAACDVLNPACGPTGAAYVFAPQKGADPDGVRLLEAGLWHWADLLQQVSGRDIRNEPGTGAAGGTALPLISLLDATIIPGVDLVSESCRLADRMADADLVLTGEGSLDAQSLMGKVVGAVGRMARSLDVPCIALVGKTGPGAEQALAVLDRYVPLDAPLSACARRLTELSRQIVREMC